MHKTQLVTYVRLTNLRVGLLLNSGADDELTEAVTVCSAVAPPLRVNQCASIVRGSWMTRTPRASAATA